VIRCDCENCEGLCHGFIYYNYPDDALSRVIEPGAPSTSERFAALKQLSDAGIYCGVLLMPVLPFINDTQKNLHDIVNLAKQNGAKYLVPALGVTLRDSQRDYFYKKLDESFPGIKEKYISRYKEQYSCQVPESTVLNQRLISACKQENIPLKMEFYKPYKPEQLSMF
jgi:DNA repair photolyase